VRHARRLHRRRAPGQSRSLVLRGEAGIGKTACYEQLVGSAADLTVRGRSGSSPRWSCAFASLQQLCAPLLDGSSG
jgi:hypothetical protein